MKSRPRPRSPRGEMFTFSLERSSDLLRLRIELQNVVIATRRGRQVIQPQAPRAFLVVYFPPQAIVERAFVEGANPDPLAYVASAQLAEESRLVFAITKDVPFTQEALLDWNSSAFVAQLHRPTTAQAGPLPLDKTSIELPYGLYLTPEGPRWVHEKDSRSFGNRTELWTTTLAGTASDGTPMAAATIRPVGWNNSDPFRGQRIALEVGMREAIVQNSIAADGAPVPAELQLSALGGWLHARGRWNRTTADLIAWDHDAAMGRDDRVVTMEAGFLFPFMHPAVWVEESARKFQHPTRSGSEDLLHIGAYVRKRFYIVVTAPVKNYGHLDAKDQRNLPFVALEMTQPTTPNLDDKILDEIAPGMVFWPRINNAIYRFPIEGTDWADLIHASQAPVIFIGKVEARNPSSVQRAAAAYQAEQTAHGGTRFSRSSISYAPPTTGPSDGARLVRAATVRASARVRATDPAPEMIFEIPGSDTALETIEMIFEGIASTALQFIPGLKQAKVALKGVEQLAGNAAEGVIKYVDTYLNHGFPTGDSHPNLGEVFAALTQGIPVPFNGGGIVESALPAITPNFNIAGLSRKLGPVNDLVNIAKGAFNPTQFFSGMASQLEAKFLGGLSLKQILSTLDLPFDVALPPQFTTETSGSPPTSITVRYHWKQGQKAFTTDEKAIFKATPDTKLEINAVMKYAIGSSVSSSLDIRMESFAIRLLPPPSDFVTVYFKHIAFTREEGSAPNIDVGFDRVEFGGALAFVAELARSIGKSGGDSGIYVDLDLAKLQIVAGLSLRIPDLTLGALTLRNILPSIAVELSLGSEPALLRFGFGEWHNRFFIAVAIFGGGGFLQVKVAPDGLRSVEGALEFGGDLSLDLLGIAKGHAYLVAGVYFYFDKNEVKLTGYVRCGGSLHILGIVTVSVEFFLGVAYRKINEQHCFWGRATLTISIDILFFSKDVHLEYERVFAGSSAVASQRLLDDGDDQTAPELEFAQGPFDFSDLMSRDQWLEYRRPFQ